MGRRGLGTCPLPCDAPPFPRLHYHRRGRGRGSLVIEGAVLVSPGKCNEAGLTDWSTQEDALMGFFNYPRDAFTLNVEDVAACTSPVVVHTGVKRLMFSNSAVILNHQTLRDVTMITNDQMIDLDALPAFWGVPAPSAWSVLFVPMETVSMMLALSRPRPAQIDRPSSEQRPNGAPLP